MHRIDSQERVSMLAEGSIHRRQDLDELLLHDGAALVCSRSALLRAAGETANPHAFFGDDRRGFRTTAGETVEIDQLRDLYLAEAVLRERGVAGGWMRLAS
jgi:hypothetical protein